MTSWSGVYMRAVIVPAGRRAGTTWLACALVAGITFGPNAMRPHDVTTLAWNNAAIAGVLAVTWCLIYLPAARVLVRGDAARYLRSLPAPRLTPFALPAVALVGFQLPWLVLWLAGDGARGGAVVVALTLPIAAIAAWRPPHHRPHTPRWRGAFAALRAIHHRALGRRAGDAVLRGVGLAILAGAVGGVFVRNNQLTGADAAVMGSSVIAVVLVPAQVGPLLVLLESHRATAWLAASLGVAPAIRTAALFAATLLVHVTTTVIALAALFAVAGPNGHVIASSLALAIGSALGGTRVLLADAEASKIAVRAILGAIVVAAIAVLALGLFGLAGIVGFVATTLLVLLR